MTKTTKIFTGKEARKKFQSINWETMPGTDIEEIRKVHPEWSEEECRDEQSRAAEVGINEMLRMNTQ